MKLFNLLSRYNIKYIRPRPEKRVYIGEEELKINQIVPKKLGGVESYSNLELLHQTCQLQHQILLEKYGGGKDLIRVTAYFNKKQIEPNCQEGYRLIKKEFDKFKYQFV